MHRRDFLTTAMGLTLGGLAAPALAQAKTKIRVGYLHTVAVDGQIWTGIDKGYFDKQIAETEAELKALGKQKVEIKVDLKQIRAANAEQNSVIERVEIRDAQLVDLRGVEAVRAFAEE